MEILYKLIGLGAILFAAFTYRWMPWWGTAASIGLGYCGLTLARAEKRGRLDGSTGWDWDDLDLLGWFSSDSSDASDASDASDSSGSGDAGGSDD